MQSIQFIQNLFQAFKEFAENKDNIGKDFEFEGNVFEFEIQSRTKNYFKLYHKKGGLGLEYRLNLDDNSLLINIFDGKILLTMDFIGYADNSRVKKILELFDNLPDEVREEISKF